LNRSIRWGFVGLGKIAHAFARDLALRDEGELVAVGSRSMENAQAFGQEHGARHAFASYEEVYSHPDVDIVYVATPHHLHAELSIASLKHGKHVLCEKPMAINAEEASAVLDAANAADRFFMEALWSRFNPAISEVLQRIRNGDIGQVRHIQADFSFVVNEQKRSRTHDLEQGGGSLLDVGIYPLFLIYAVLGMPDSLQAEMIRHASGVDEQMAMVLRYDKALATAYSGFVSQSNMQATISGERGRIILNPTWHEANDYSMFDNLDWDGNRVERPKTGHGLVHEIDACHHYLRDNLRESPEWSHADCLNLMKLMDAARQQVGLTYPADSWSKT